MNSLDIYVNIARANSHILYLFFFMISSLLLEIYIPVSCKQNLISIPTFQVLIRNFSLKKQGPISICLALTEVQFKQRWTSLTLMWPLPSTTIRMLLPIRLHPINNVANSDLTRYSHVASDIVSMVTHIRVSPLTPVLFGPDLTSCL